ncbi:unnamed protein product [Caenorhabditis angaria]|uniref:Methyltransferase FkbM domain-containing protein n=1 Tax=Caenorhabditis angaria TaxID=860376 RepID=A0A9P1IEF0_9PELO|nr:unnamed protein product [Caenorhabditis angaria]
MILLYCIRAIMGTSTEFGKVRIMHKGTAFFKKTENIRIPWSNQNPINLSDVYQTNSEDLSDVYQTNFEKRKSFLEDAKNARQSLLNASKQMDNKLFYEKITIEAFCPNIERVGSSGDGGKFVCNPELSRKGCILLSLGLNNQITFEEDFQNRTKLKCKLFGIDVSQQNDMTLKSYKNIGGKAYVGEIGKNYPIAKLLDESSKKQADFLKIDIEGAEHYALIPFLKNNFVCQIFLEIHYTPTQQMKLMSQIANLGFRLFNFEPNPLCPQCCEYSYINELCMDEYNVVLLSYRVPLDFF